MNYHFKIYKEKKGYWADCLELEGCHTQGDDLEELIKNCHEVLELYVDEPDDSKILMNFPDKKNAKKKSVIEVSLTGASAFSFLIRQLRLRGPKTQKNMAALLGYKNLNGYQVLENSKIANPTLKTLMKIKEKFPEFDLNEIVSA